jgi:hypothetical protein
MGYNVHDASRNVVAYYTKKTLKFKFLIFGYDLKLLSFLRTKN